MSADSELIIGVDFDGTVVKFDYPRIGAPVPYALNTLRQLVAEGHRIVLWTVRSGKELAEAVDYMKINGIALYGVNENPDQKNWSESPKAFCHMYIDDSAVGCPLIEEDTDAPPYVDWKVVGSWLGDMFEGINWQ